MNRHPWPDRYAKYGEYVLPEEPKPIPSLRIVSAASFAGRPIPARSWLVPDLVPDHQVTLLSGDGGVGKSLLALQLCVGVATATDWIGTLPAIGPALYVGAEDEIDEIHRRLADIATGRGMDLADLGDLHILSLAGQDAVLAAPEAKDIIGMTPLWHAIETEVERIRPRLLVIDNSADAFAGNEISRAQVRQFVGALRGAAIRHGMAVLLLSHPSLTGISSGTGTSGSTAWSNSARSRLYLDRPKQEEGAVPDHDDRVLKVMKSNYSAGAGETRLRWRDGMLRLQGGASTGFDRVASDAQAERVFLDLIGRLDRQGRHVSHQRSVSFAPAVFVKEPDNSGFGKGAFEAAMTRLFAAGRIRVETHGPASKQRSHIVAVTP